MKLGLSGWPVLWVANAAGWVEGLQASDSIANEGCVERLRFRLSFAADLALPAGCSLLLHTQLSLTIQHFYILNVYIPRPSEAVQRGLSRDK